MRSASLDLIVGIDDTDMPGTPGTGRLARLLAEELAGIGPVSGVTRHQLYQGPGVPKTHRNSAAAIGMTGAVSPEEILGAAARFLLREHAPGSDPGVAVVAGSPPGEVVAFARRAQSGLVDRDEAQRIAADAGVPVIGLAGTRDGLIGALAAAALRAEGNDGRYIGLSGIRQLEPVCTVDEILACSGIAAVIDVDTGDPLAGGSRLDTGNWVRPRLIGGRPVLMARRHEGAWVNADARPG
ncbi:MAG TPA: hypothetical protein VLL51_01265 [Gemmatimonadales bacterium]|nr:hypothetical protein [Gemmatimonadales bacterium]